MKKNMGNADRLIRIIAAAVFIVLYFNNMLPAPWGLVLLIPGVVFALTSLVGFCPLYSVFGISTCPKKKTA